MNDAFKRGFAKGWTDHRKGRKPKTNFSRNSPAYAEGYRKGQQESEWEIKRDGRDAAYQDFQSGIYHEQCALPGYHEHHLKLTQERGRDIAYKDLCDGNYDPDCAVPGYQEFFRERGKLQLAMTITTHA